MYVSKSKKTPKNKCLLQKNILTINFVQLTHEACQIVSTFTS